MENAVLVVSENEKSFTVQAVMSALERVDIKAISFSANDPDLGPINFDLKIEESEFVLIQGGTDWSLHVHVLQLIREKCAELNKKILLYGSQEELAFFKRTIPDTLILEEYVKPLDANSVASKIQDLLERVTSGEQMKKILVVDDSGAMLRNLMELLEDKYIVSLANSAVNAFKVIQKDKPDLILLDYEMPVCSGAQFFEMLKAEEEISDIPVIFLTSRGDEETVKEVIALKPAGYILKTTGVDTLLAKIEAFFAS